MADQENRFTKCFTRLAEKKEGALVPFVTLGDPCFEASLEILKTLSKAGADALAVAIPFSDASADGIAIQKSHHRALSQGMTIRRCFELLKEFREFDNNIPITIHAYSYLVISFDVERFYQQAHDIGVDAVLLPDVALHLLDDEYKYRTQAQLANVGEVLITPPNSSKEIIEYIASIKHCYTYVLSKHNVIDPRKIPSNSMINNPRAIMNILKEQGSTPGLLGLGINTQEDVQMAMRAGAAGVIIGSAVVKLIADNINDSNIMLGSIDNLIKLMKKSTLPEVYNQVPKPQGATQQVAKPQQAPSSAQQQKQAHAQAQARAQAMQRQQQVQQQQQQQQQQQRQPQPQQAQQVKK